MAEEAGFFLPKPLNPETQVTATDEDKQVTWADWGKALGIGALNVGSSLAAASEFTTKGAVGGDARRAMNETAEDIQRSTSPAFQQAANSEFLPGQGETGVFDVGLGRAIGAKAVTAAPSVVASLVPAGLAVWAARGLGAGVTMAGAVGTGAARASSGVQNMGDTANQIYQAIDKLPDDELAQKAPVFAGYMAMGMYPKEARERYMAQVASNAPIIAGAVGLMTPGVEGQVARRLGGEAAKGVFRGARTGAVAEGLQEGAESLTGEGMSQHALAEAGLGELDWRKLLSKTIEGGVVGSVMGAGPGAAAGIGGRTQTAQPSPQPVVQDEIHPEIIAATTGEPIQDQAQVQPEAAAPAPQDAVQQPKGMGTGAQGRPPRM